jgi:hypothetical protein
MDLFDDILIAGLVWSYCRQRCVERQLLRGLRRLAREPVTPQRDSPSPHRLLGDIARPLATRRRGKHSATT